MPKFLKKIKDKTKHHAINTAKRKMGRDMHAVENLLKRIKQNKTRLGDTRDLNTRFYKQMKKLKVEERNDWTNKIMDYWPEFIERVKKRQINKKDIKFIDTELKPYYDSCLDVLTERAIEWANEQVKNKKGGV